jgi:hypothetical protein
MNTITLQGLTARQKTLCEIMWSFDNMDTVNAFAQLYGQEAMAMRDLMVAEVLDQRRDIDPTVVDFLNRL